MVTVINSQFLNLFIAAEETNYPLVPILLEPTAARHPNGGTMYTVYTIPGSCSSAITILLEKLQQEYEPIKREFKEVKI